MIVMLGCIWWCFWSFVALFALIIVLSMNEFYSLLKKNEVHPQVIPGIILGLFAFAGAAWGAYSIGPIGPIIYSGVALVLSGSFFFIELFRKKEKPFQNVAFTLLGVIYIAFPFSLFNTMVPGFDAEAWNNGSNDTFLYLPHFLLAFFFMVWSNDTFAYLTGRAFGRTKFFERISPKKTWEGTIGGVLLTQGTAYLISIYFKELDLVHWMMMAGIVSITATLGDLVESMFKRSINIKDSGGILPGHGGLLDRFDGVLLSAPFVCLYLLMVR